MKIEELSIGDWVYGFDGKPNPVRISALDIYPLNRTPRIVTYGGYGYQIEHLSPIPLTPEILEKNGFSGEGYNMGIIGFHTDPIPEVKDGYEVFIWKDMCLEIKHGFTHLKRYTFYVHELQHALRLCGIEKEITL